MSDEFEPNVGIMSDDIPGAPRQAPLAVLLLLIGAVPMVMVLQFCAAVFGAAVVPLFDAAPLAVVFVAVVARPWRGVAKRWLKAALVLALVMLLEWVPVWVLMSVAFSGDVASGRAGEVLSLTLFLYLAESVLLLALTAVGSVASVVGIIRARNPLSLETA